MWNNFSNNNFDITIKWRGGEKISRNTRKWNFVFRRKRGVIWISSFIRDGNSLFFHKVHRVLTPKKRVNNNERVHNNDLNYTFLVQDIIPSDPRIKTFHFHFTNIVHFCVLASCEQSLIFTELNLYPQNIRKLINF